MGFVLSILYFLTYYLTPTVMFGSLAEYRIELILAGVIAVVSLPALSGSSVGKTAQLPALVGLAFATFMSVVVGASWAGGGVTALLLFIPNAFAYLLVCLHCTTKRKVQTVILMMLFVCFFVIGQGALELRHGLPQGIDARDVDMSGSYFLGMSNEHKEWFYRLRGQGQINDPNDFAQLIVCVLPLMFFFWQKKAEGPELLFCAGTGWNPAVGSVPDTFARLHPCADGRSDRGAAKENRDGAFASARRGALRRRLCGWLYGRQRYFG